jgi:purine-binding chemotaxis protein CheW
MQRADAQSGAGGEAARQSPQYLTFALAGEVFALGILAIKEIIEYSAPTGVPMMPEYLRGVINLRGLVVPVIDLAVRFGKPASPVTKRTCVVIVEIELDGERYEVGEVVDAVHAVVEIPASEIEPPPSFGARIRTDFIAGMGKVDGRFVIVLDAKHVLAPAELESLAATVDSRAA